MSGGYNHKQNCKCHFCSKNHTGSKGMNWKGDNIKHSALHVWLRSCYGKANKCENREKHFLDFECNRKTNVFEWALRKGFKYLRRRHHFVQLCKSCHLKYDHTSEEIKKRIDNARKVHMKKGQLRQIERQKKWKIEKEKRQKERYLQYSVFVKCQICNKIKRYPNCLSRIKYCSRKCYYLSKTKNGTSS